MLSSLTKPKQQTPKLTNASARVVGGKMILSLPDAIAPVVWQMDLGPVKASALEVTPNEDANEFTLTLKATGVKSTEIAKFDNREFAVEPPMAACEAL